MFCFNQYTSNTRKENDNITLKRLCNRIRSNDRTLQEIHLHGVPISKEMSKELANCLSSSNHHVQSIELKYCYIEDGVGRMIYNSFVNNNRLSTSSSPPSPVQNVTIENCGFDDNDAIYIAKLLSSKMTCIARIKKLRIGIGYIGTKQGLHTIITEGLRNNTCQEEIDFSCCQYFDDYTAALLSENVFGSSSNIVMDKDKANSDSTSINHQPSSSNLKILNLSNTLISDIGLRIIMKSLINTSSSSSSSSATTSSSTRGGVGTGTGRNTKLHTMNLSHTLVSIDSIECIIEFLECHWNTSLRNIRVSHLWAYEINDTSIMEKLTYYLLQNRAGRSLLIDICNSNSFCDDDYCNDVDSYDDDDTATRIVRTNSNSILSSTTSPSQLRSTKTLLAPYVLENANSNPRVMYGLLKEVPHIWTTC